MLKRQLLIERNIAENKILTLLKWLKENHREIYDEYLRKVNIVTGEIEK